MSAFWDALRRDFLAVVEQDRHRPPPGALSENEMTSTFNPGRVFTDMHAPNCTVSAEFNNRSDDDGGGVWICANNRDADKIVAIDLSDEDAIRLGQFLLSVTEWRATR